MFLYDFRTLRDDLNTFIEAVKPYSNHYANFFGDLSITGLRFCELQEFNRWENADLAGIKCNTAKDSYDRFFLQDQFYSNFFQRVIDQDNIYLRINNSTASYYFYIFFPRKRVYNLSKPLTNHLFRHFYAKNLKDQKYSDEDIQGLMGEVSRTNSDGYIYSELYYEER